MRQLIFSCGLLVQTERPQLPSAGDALSRTAHDGCRRLVHHCRYSDWHRQWMILALVGSLSQTPRRMRLGSLAPLTQTPRLGDFGDRFPRRRCVCVGETYRKRTRGPRRGTRTDTDEHGQMDDLVGLAFPLTRLPRQCSGPHSAPAGPFGRRLCRLLEVHGFSAVVSLPLGAVSARLAASPFRWGSRRRSRGGTWGPWGRGEPRFVRGGWRRRRTSTEPGR